MNLDITFLAYNMNEMNEIMYRYNQTQQNINISFNLYGYE